MNLLYRGNASRNGFETKLLSRLKKEGVFTKCITINQSIDEKDDLTSIEGVKVYPAGWFYDIMTFRKKIRFEKLMPLSEEILELMLPYESMALRTAMRETNFMVHEYSECKRLYLDFLRFWNHVLVKEKINMLFFHVTPHCMWEYILCKLAEVKGLKVVTIDPCTFSGRFVKGYSLDKHGEDIAECYHRLLKEERKEIDLPQDLEEYYKKQLNGKKNGLVVSTNTPKEKEYRKKINKGTFSMYITLKSMYRRFYGDCSSIYHAFCDKKNRRWALEKVHRHFSLTCRSLKKRFFEMKTQKFYNRDAVVPDLSEKFVYFALQMSPESTTMPRGGVFVEQQLSIQILAKALAEVGAWLYVKEHYIQAFREKWFYEEIKKIPNVKLIKTSVNTYDLIENCMAVATLTGSCIWEGIIRNKPALVFGKDYFWIDAPGVYKISSCKQCINVLKQIINGQVRIDSWKVRVYLKAIGERTIKSYLDNPSALYFEPDPEQVSLEEICHLIKEEKMNMRELQV